MDSDRKFSIKSIEHLLFHGYYTDLKSLTKTQLEKISRYHLRTLRNLQSLSQRTATSAVYMLFGALPIEAELHKGQLSSLHCVIKSENQCLQGLVERQLACSFKHQCSYFYIVNQALQKYDLPILNDVTLNFIQRKNLYTKEINSLWTKRH